MNKSKVVVITGGSSGIGAACVDKFCTNNYQVINLDIAAPDKEQGLFIKTNLTDVLSIKKAFVQIVSKFKAVDILIANAGIHKLLPITDVSEEDYSAVVDTNIKATFFTVQEALKIMQKQGGGRIITMGSDQTFVARSQSALYGLTKAAIAQFTKSIALDYAKHGIIANCVAPGTVDTPLYQKVVEQFCALTKQSSQEIRVAVDKSQPANRIATAPEIADFIYYLATTASSYIQGTTLTIDGGYTIQ